MSEEFEKHGAVVVSYNGQSKARGPSTVKSCKKFGWKKKIDEKNKDNKLKVVIDPEQKLWRWLIETPLDSGTTPRLPAAMVLNHNGVVMNKQWQSTGSPDPKKMLELVKEIEKDFDKDLKKAQSGKNSDKDKDDDTDKDDESSSSE